MTNKAVILSNNIALWNAIDLLISKYDMREWSEEKRKKLDEMLTEVQDSLEKEINEMLPLGWN